MQSATRKKEPGAADSAARVVSTASKRAKLAVLLVTRDDMLWPQIGGHIGNELLLKQVDSIDELLSATQPGQAAIVLWDARNQTDAAAVLSRLQLHSPRFAVVILDESGNSPAWAGPIALRQVIAHVSIPVAASSLASALDNAEEEVNARVALLGEGGGAANASATPDAPPGAKKIPWLAVVLIAAAAAAGGAYFTLQKPVAAAKPATVPTVSPAAVPTQAAKAPSMPAAADEKVDLLIEKAQQAMQERHFIDPADGSALTLYRSALLLDPNNGEARQGLERLAEILFARVQSALDERKIDVALQALETARSINPGDSRLSALDERIASLRAEFGPAQILAAINAQNFDRAAQLIDEAAHTKSLPSAKLAQLRDEMRRRHQELDVANFVKLIDTRLQQDKVFEPRNDSAAYYLGQARTAGAGAAAVQSQSQDIFKRLAQTLRTDIDQKRFADGDRLLADARSYALPAPSIAGLQRDLNAARGQQAAATAERTQFADLAQSRLAQGKVVEPDNDSALFYVNQLRSSDPTNSALTRISGAVQAQILDQARSALDAAQTAKAESLLQMAAGLGTSADFTALNQRLAQAKAAGPATPEVAEATLTRTKSIELNYPEDALRRNIEGWVDLSYLVAPDGKVSKVKVLQSNPAGVFDVAAARAIARIRYKPPMQDGKPIGVSTKMRITFRVTK